jgi:hypothetical protein
MTLRYVAAMWWLEEVRSSGRRASDVVKIIKIQADEVHESPSKGILCEADLSDANLRNNRRVTNES